MSTRNARSNAPKMNEAIRATDVRLIGKDGEMLGVFTLADARAKAAEAKLDLVEIVPQAEPPVCKIMDHGKFKYEAQKKKRDARKKQKTVALKELKLSPNIDQHDLGIKIKNATRFLEAGDKVKFSLRYRGREITHKEVGMNIINQVRERLAQIGKVETEPKFEGRQVFMIMMPLK